MVWLLLTIGLILLSLFWFFLNWKSKKELIKLRRNYDEEENKSRNGGVQAPGRSSDISGCGKKAIRSTPGKPSPKGDDKPKREVLLPVAENIVDESDSGEHRESNPIDTEPKKRFSIRRRK